MTSRRNNPIACLVCRSTEKISRGLCDRHYRRFNAKYKKLEQDKSKETAEEFERLSVEKGLIFPKSKGGKPRELDPFDILAEIAVAVTSGDYDNVKIAEMVAKGDELIRQEVAKRRLSNEAQSNLKKAD